MPAIGGTNGKDSLTGNGDVDDVIHGLAGNDTIDGLGGHDTIFGDAGDDTILVTAMGSAPGISRIDGGSGIDTLDFHTLGTNTFLHIEQVDADAFRLRDFFGPTVDRIENIEKLVLGPNAMVDLSTWTHPITIVTGEVQTAYVMTGTADDSMTGGSFGDAFFTNGGNDLIAMGGGDDGLTIAAVSSHADHVIADGGSGTDAFYVAFPALQNSGTTIDLAAGTATIGLTIVNLTGFENAFAAGSAYTSFLFGDGADNVLTTDGSPGSVMIDGRGGDDAIAGGEGADIFYGGTGDDAINAAGGNDHIYGNSISAVQGAIDGDDVIEAGDGSDYVNGNAGNDAIDGGLGSDRIYGGSGDDLLGGDDGNDHINGNKGDDTIFGDDGNDMLLGGQGDDRIEGGEGSDQLSGDAGNDTLVGGLEQDWLTGGEGSDLFDYSSGGMLLSTPTGIADIADRITDFQLGSDKIHFIWTPSVVLTAIAVQADFAAARNVAEQMLNDHPGTAEIVAVGVGTDTYLLFSGYGGGNAATGGILLQHVGVTTIDLSDFV